MSSLAVDLSCLCKIFCFVKSISLMMMLVMVVVNGDNNNTKHIGFKDV